MKFARWLKRLSLAAILMALAGTALYYLTRPAPMPRTEIYRGVYLTVESLPDSPHGNGRIMIVEVHWDTPGVTLRNRPYSFAPFGPSSPHYRLANADWALWREEARVLVNTTGYEPSDWWRSLPGMPVRSHETIVVDGVPSHLHQHTYLMYWDEDLEAHQLLRKPPDAESLAQAQLALGIQGVPISDGKARYHAIAGHELVMPRTFIGFDPARKILWLMAFENADVTAMLERAVEAGVQFGGMMDSGGSTHLLVGAGARGLRSHTGIRHWRPLGSYLMVHAEPL